MRYVEKNRCAGKDATDDFEDVGHSVTAKAMMDEYYIGDIDASTIPKRKPSHQERLSQSKQNSRPFH